MSTTSIQAGALAEGIKQGRAEGLRIALNILESAFTQDEAYKRIKAKIAELSK